MKNSLSLPEFSTKVADSRYADSAVEWLRNAGARFIAQRVPLHPALATWRGGQGEAEVISWAINHPEFLAILDDRRAREFATRNGVQILGSLRVIVPAKERGLIQSARPALERLKGEGGWISDQLIRRAIELAGEA